MVPPLEHVERFVDRGGGGQPRIDVGGRLDGRGQHPAQLDRGVGAHDLVTAIEDRQLRTHGVKLARRIRVVKQPGAGAVVERDRRRLRLEARPQRCPGHLVEGCPIYTTAEIIIGEAQALRFTREPDEQIGYKELKIHPRAQQKRRA